MKHETLFSAKKKKQTIFKRYQVTHLKHALDMLNKKHYMVGIKLRLYVFVRM